MLLVQVAELEKQARIDADKSLQARREVLDLCAIRCPWPQRTGRVDSD
jgi:hypothetical protein